jgi:hypothetical protein
MGTRVLTHLVGPPQRNIPRDSLGESRLLTFHLKNSRFGFGFGIWGMDRYGVRRLLRGFQFHPPSRNSRSRMDRRRRALLSDTGPLRLIAGSLTFPKNGALTY